MYIHQLQQENNALKAILAASKVALVRQCAGLQQKVKTIETENKVLKGMLGLVKAQRQGKVRFGNAYCLA